jgi:formate dehydrogenase major subunit
LILADPRRLRARAARDHFLQFKSDTDVALLNAMMHTIIEEGLVAEKFVADRTSGFAELRDNVAAFSPEAMAPVCGVDADTIRTVARMFATSRAAMILWGMGISQHVHGTDNARCLIALTMLTGQVGRPGTGLHPLRGQNNVQGASDAGLIPMMYPDYRRVDNAGAQGKFEALWGDDAGSKAGADRGRDHERGPRRRHPRHVHHGREPGDVGSGRPGTHGRRSPSSRCSSSRISFSPRPAIWPT